MGSAVLAAGFGTSVAMWSVGYIGRLPAVMLPSPLLLLLMLACLVAGGLLLGRHTSRGLPGGAAAGAISGLINLLVLGSFLGGSAPGRIVPATLVWVPGSILLSSFLSGAGAVAGTRWLPAARPFRDWTTAFVRVAAVATLLLLAVGGLVTSAEAGMAVEDWPTSFGYNMFLYPLARMTGGIYYEHAHRLFGALVGLTTLVMALLLQRTEPRRWMRVLAWSALLIVAVQGLLGGLRVTGRSLPLAMLHGVLAQLFFVTLVAMSAFSSATWTGPAVPLRRDTARTDRVLASLLVGITLGQLVLGASQRHFDALLFVHMGIGVALVAPLAIHVGFRAWGLSVGQPILQRLGLALVALVCLQLVLGFAALIVKSTTQSTATPTGLDLAVSTAHQWVGAILLGVGVLLGCWSFRLLETAPPGERGR